MKEIILLSDLWGKERFQWLAHYTSLLQKHFQLSYYDCRELGDISAEGLSEEELHTRFLNGGIKRAVERLLERDKEAFAVLGFSVGGYIAWKACQEGFRAQKLVALSSTRLRNESQKPDLRIDLCYGENDRYRPGARWFEEMGIEEYILVGEGHEFYVKQEIAEEICKRLIQLDSIGVG